MKTAIGGSLLGAALLLAANGGGCAEEEKIVKIYNWPDYIAQDTVCDFEARSSIDVVYEVFDSNKGLEAKLSAGDSGFDRVVPSGAFLEREIAAGLLQRSRQGEARQLLQTGPGNHGAGLEPRSGQPPRHSLPLGHDRLRLQHVHHRRAHAGHPGRELAHAIRPRGDGETRRLRYRPARCADGRDPRGAHLSRPQSAQQGGSGPGGGRGGAHGLAPPHQVFSLPPGHQRPRRWRRVPGHGLVGRRPARHGLGRGDRGRMSRSPIPSTRRMRIYGST